MTKKSILIVDDEKTNVVLLKSLFPDNEYIVAVAKDGEEGLNQARKLIPDLILMDVMMPKINGFKACGLIKADSQLKSIPVVILSSRAGDDDLKLSKQVGADGYMIKPIIKKDVCNTLNSLLGWTFAGSASE